MKITGLVINPSIKRDLALGFVLLLVLGLATMMVMEHVFDRQTGFINLVNTAGRLRMLSQRIAYTAHRVESDPRQTQVWQEELQHLLSRFDEDLAELRQVNRAMGVLSEGAVSGGADLALVTQQWEEYRRAAVIVAAQAPHSSPALQALRYLDDYAQPMLESADSNVKNIVDHSVADRIWLSMVMFAMLAAGLVSLVSAFVYFRRRLLQPFSAISGMAERLAQGDFSARADCELRGEVGDLVRTLNLTAAAMQQLFAQRALAEEVLRESEIRSRMMLEASHDAIICTDALGIIAFANESATTVFGYGPGELIGQAVYLLFPERHRASHQAGVEELRRQGTQSGSWRSMEIWAVHKSGREIRVDLAVSHVRVRSGDMFTGFFRDLSTRNAVMADLNLCNRAIESTGEGIMITDAQLPSHPIIYTNPAFERVTGYAQADVLGKNGRLLLGSELEQPDVEALRQILRDQREGLVTLQCIRKDGGRFWSEVAVAPVRVGRGTVTHYISVFKDVTERIKQMEEMLRWAHHDTLTGLPNRILFQDRMQQAIAAATRRGHKLGVLFIDLDGFKVINDSLGHDAGDTLLREAASRLQQCVRDGDTVARLGGDEFIMLLNEMDQQYGIEPVAQRTLTALGRAFILGGQEVFVGASIGTSVFPRDGEQGDVLVRNADLAMYRAKAHGRNHVQAFSAEMHSQREHWMTLEAKLRRAVDQGDFLLHFQPQLSLSNGQVVGAEALVRWQEKDMGLVAPGHFIALAEETGLIGAIGEWVLNSTCIQIAQWLRQGLPVPRIAVNISARQFRQPDLFTIIEQSLGRQGLDASRLEVELTESMVMQDPDRTIALLTQMREAGLHLSLDDFGTGYSSLSYLRRFPLDVLKVDQSFVREVTSNEEAAAIAGAIITLAHSLNLGVVAEGVETAEQLDFLIAQRCDVIQGFYFSRPLPAAEFASFLQRNQQPEACVASF